MRFSLRRWRPRHLLLAWIGYWLTLALVSLGPPALTVWRVSRSPSAHGTLNVSAGFGDGLIRLTVAENGATIWDGSASPLTIILWLVGPPLALWLLWLLRRPGRRPAHGAEAARTTGSLTPPGGTPAALRAADGMDAIAMERLAERQRAAQPAGRERDPAG